MTRANVYCCDTFLGEVGGDAYPGGDFWDLMWKIDQEQWTEKKAKEAVKQFILDNYDDHYLPPKSTGVGNWSYDYVIVPVEAPKDYMQWDQWKIRVLCRKPDWRLLSDTPWQIPGPWKTLMTVQAEELKEING